MRKWCVVALVISLSITVGAALLNMQTANADEGADIGAGLLFLFGGLSTIVSAFCVLGSSSAAEVRRTASKDDEVKTAWPRSQH